MNDAAIDMSDPAMVTVRRLKLPLVVLAFTVISVVSLTFSIAVSSIAMGSAIICCVAAAVLSRGKAFPRTPLDLFFIAYAVAEGLSTVFSVDPLASLVYMKRLFLISFVYLVLFSMDDRRTIMSVLALLVGVVAVLSVIELFSLTSIGGSLARISLFQYYMTEGGIKMIALLMVLPFIIHPSTPGKWRWLFLAASAVTFIGLILTQTRSSWLGFIAGAITIGFLKNKKVLAGLLILIVLVALLAPSTYRMRALSIVDPAYLPNLTRVRMITTGWRMFLDRPIVGTGDIDLRKLYETYIIPIDTAEGGHLHNNFMQLLVTLGVIGISAAGAMFVKVFLVEREAVRAASGDWLLGSVAAGSLASYIGFHVNGLFEWNFGDHEIAVLLWFTVGLALVALRQSQPEAR